MAHLRQIHESFIIFYAPSKKHFHQNFQTVGLFPELLENPSILQHARKHFSMSMDSPQTKQDEWGKIKTAGVRLTRLNSILLTPMNISFGTRCTCNPGEVAEAMNKLFYEVGSDGIWESLCVRLAWESTRNKTKASGKES